MQIFFVFCLFCTSLMFTNFDDHVILVFTRFSCSHICLIFYIFVLFTRLFNIYTYSRCWCVHSIFPFILNIQTFFQELLTKNSVSVLTLTSRSFKGVIFSPFPYVPASHIKDKEQKSSIKSSHWRYSVKKVVLEISQNSKFLKTPFLQNTSARLLLLHHKCLLWL